MEANINKVDGQTVITVIGRMDTLNSKEFEQSIQPLLKEDNANILINCEDLEYISSSGLRIFMSLLKHVNNTNGQLVLEKMTHDVKDVFDMTGFSALFNIR
jgi:anti-anti-sigma factor